MTNIGQESMTVVYYLLDGGSLFAETIPEQQKPKAMRAAQIIRTLSGGRQLHVLQGRDFFVTTEFLAGQLDAQVYKDCICYLARNICPGWVMDVSLWEFLRKIKQAEPCLVVVVTKKFLNSLLATTESTKRRQIDPNSLVFELHVKVSLRTGIVQERQLKST
ncbi:MAG TPA: hypothetical protein VFT87_01345 [Candidatus Saccharimonadales bacterium]|nr:hypothetical protein [Candidatus Saccharimonadales bacterium]